MAAGDGDNFLDLSLQDQGEEEVEKVDVAGDVGLVQFDKVVLKLFHLVGAVERVRSVSIQRRRTYRAPMGSNASMKDR